MGSLNPDEGGCFVLLVCLLLNLMVWFGGANVVLMGKNVSLSFNDLEANFAPSIKGSGESGVLYLAEPLNACTQLDNISVEGPPSPFLLVIRGGCPFDDKVRNAESAGYKAAIVYDNEDSGTLVSMAGSPSGIHIHAVFVSKASGETLKKYAGHRDIGLWIIPTFENSAWSIMAISFISLLALSAVLSTCFFVRRHRVRHHVREFHGMSSQLVKAMPTLIFTSVLEDNCTSTTCAICLEDYSVGEKLRILPCCHKFHALCIDAWLTSWRTFCPICKRDVLTVLMNPPASESTPLLSSIAASHSSSVVLLSSFRSSMAASPSPAIPIISTPPRSPITSQTHSFSNFSRPPIPHRCYSNLMSIHTSISTAELRHASFSYISHGSSFTSPNCLGYPISSPYVSRQGSNFLNTLNNASPSFLGGSSSRHSYLQHSESGMNLSAMESAYSLPGCS